VQSGRHPWGVEVPRGFLHSYGARGGGGQLGQVPRAAQGPELVIEVHLPRSPNHSRVESEELEQGAGAALLGADDDCGRQAPLPRPLQGAGGPGGRLGGPGGRGGPGGDAGGGQGGPVEEEDGQHGGAGGGGALVAGEGATGAPHSLFQLRFLLERKSDLA